ncbi:corA-like Mg2+ transporter protein domain-containing protein [Hirsutella rhossiliensis]
MVIPLFDQVIKLYDDSAWRVRDKVREIERNRGTHTTDFVAMHDISRHAGHLVEVHAATVETMRSLLHRQEIAYRVLPSLNKTYKEQAHEYLNFQLQMIKSLQRRSLSIQERINSEITLAYNIMAVQDNTVMKSIALLTVTFLPATFISALFSTTFFSFAEESWNISKKFWIYWVVAIPSTLLVLIIWWLSLKRASLQNRWR